MWKNFLFLISKQVSTHTVRRVASEKRKTKLAAARPLIENPSLSLNEFILPFLAHNSVVSAIGLPNKRGTSEKRTVNKENIFATATAEDVNLEYILSIYCRLIKHHKAIKFSAQQSRYGSFNGITVFRKGRILGRSRALSARVISIKNQNRMGLSLKITGSSRSQNLFRLQDRGESKFRRLWEPSLRDVLFH